LLLNTDTAGERSKAPEVASVVQVFVGCAARLCGSAGRSLIMHELCHVFGSQPIKN
jgi:hypothetical protein